MATSFKSRVNFPPLPQIYFSSYMILFFLANSLPKSKRQEKLRKYSLFSLNPEQNPQFLLPFMSSKLSNLSCNEHEITCKVPLFGLRQKNIPNFSPQSSLKISFLLLFTTYRHIEHTTMPMIETRNQKFPWHQEKCPSYQSSSTSLYFSSIRDLIVSKPTTEKLQSCVPMYLEQFWNLILP